MSLLLAKTTIQILEKSQSTIDRLRAVHGRLFKAFYGSEKPDFTSQETVDQANNVLSLLSPEEQFKTVARSANVSALLAVDLGDVEGETLTQYQTAVQAVLDHTGQALPFGAMEFTASGVEFFKIEENAD